MTKHDKHDKHESAEHKSETAGLFDPDKVAKRREFFKGIFDAIKSIDPDKAMSFLQLLMGLFGGMFGAKAMTAEESHELETDVHLAMQPHLPAATGIDPVKLAKWVEFFKMLLGLFTHKPAPTPATLAIGDRLDGIKSIGDFLKGIDTDKINQIVAQLTAFIKMIMDFFGVTTPAATAMSAEEQTAVGALWSPEIITTKAIDLGAIYALVQLILQLVAMFRKPTSPTAYRDAEGKPLSNATEHKGG